MQFNGCLHTIRAVTPIVTALTLCNYLYFNGWLRKVQLVPLYVKNVSLILVHFSYFNANSCCLTARWSHATPLRFVKCSWSFRMRTLRRCTRNSKVIFSNLIISIVNFDADRYCFRGIVIEHEIWRGLAVICNRNENCVSRITWNACSVLCCVCNKYKTNHCD